LLFVRNDQDQRYTFSESGNYKVRLTASNAKCLYMDSVEVKMSDSELQVPSVFTPNGDNINDEFRVAYRSLAVYKAGFSIAGAGEYLAGTILRKVGRSA
jgi:hypothetical protein